MEIDSKATVCPHCRSKQGPGKVATIIGAIILLFIVIGTISVLSGSKNDGQTSNQSATTSTNEVKVTPTPEKVSARDLADDFDNNAVAAKDKWKDRLIEFSAQISNITDSGVSFYDVASKQFSVTQISCRIKDKQQLLPLKNGQTVTVRGVVGGQTVGVIDIGSCEVVE